MQLHRHYVAGERIAYKMDAINQGRFKTVRYQAEAEAQVERDPAGVYSEAVRWTALTLDGSALPLTSASRHFQENLSLAPDFKLTVPDLSKVQPALIGPIVDLLTFYADVQLAMRQTSLRRSGDHVLFHHGTPNSWADGTYTLFGQNAVDFDITFAALNRTRATLVVRHVPPSVERIPFPAAWMATPISDAPNNWAEVEKDASGRYQAEVGRETFEVTIELDPASGRILFAKMDNPVDVLARECIDRELATCGVPTRYQTRRQISLAALELH